MPSEPPTDLPEEETVLELFAESKGSPVISSSSTYLFPSFAQWFTDGFLLTDKKGGRRTFSSQQIDLNQVYGTSEEQTRALRANSWKEAERGQLQTLTKRGEMFAPMLFLPDGTRDPAYSVLPEPERFGYRASPEGVRSLRLWRRARQYFTECGNGEHTLHQRTQPEP